MVLGLGEGQEKDDRTVSGVTEAQPCSPLLVRICGLPTCRETTTNCGHDLGSAASTVLVRSEGMPAVAGIEAGRNRLSFNLVSQPRNHGRGGPKYLPKNRPRAKTWSSLSKVALTSSHSLTEKEQQLKERERCICHQALWSQVIRCLPPPLTATEAVVESAVWGSHPFLLTPNYFQLVVCPAFVEEGEM